MGMITMELIKHIGQSAIFLIDNGLIKDSRYGFNFEGDDTFYMRPEEGILLAFDALTHTLQSVQITLIKITDEHIAYTGEMPSPFQHSMDKASVRSLLGIPDQTSEQKNIPGLGVIGGHDSYINRLSDYPNVQARALYCADNAVRAIAFDALETIH